MLGFLRIIEARQRNLISAMQSEKKENYIFILPTATSPQTGGQRYDFLVLKRLEKRGTAFRTIAYNPLFKGFRHSYARCNLVLARTIGIGRGRLIVEDFSVYSRAFLFNFLAGFIYRDKIIFLVHHLPHYDTMLSSGWKRLLVRQMEKVSLRMGCRIITTSENTRENLSRFGVNPDRIIVIHPGADEIPVIKTRKKNGLAILFVGHCIKRKGLEFLIRALSMVKNKKFKCHLIGSIEHDKSYYEMLRKVSDDIGVADKLVFHGLVSADKLWEFYNMADIFVMPSMFEGFGIGIIEAMRARLPVIASNVGIATDLLISGENGISVPPGDVKSLVNALDTLMGDAGLRKLYGTRGFDAVDGKFSWDLAAERFHNVLRELSN